MIDKFLPTNSASAANLSLAVGAGLIEGMLGNTMDAIGIGVTVGTTPVLIQPNTGAALVYPSDAGEIVSVASLSAADAGKIVNVEGINENDEFAEVFVALDGTTPVEIGVWKRINYMRMLTSNAGEVRCTVAGGIVCYITTAGSNVSSIGRFSVPAGYTVQVLDLISAMTKDGGGTNAAAISSVWIRLLGQDFFLAFAFAIERRNSVSFTNFMPLATPGPVDIEIRGYADATGSDVYVRLAMLFRDN